MEILFSSTSVKARRHPCDRVSRNLRKVLNTKNSIKWSKILKKLNRRSRFGTRAQNLKKRSNTKKTIKWSRFPKKLNWWSRFRFLNQVPMTRLCPKKPLKRWSRTVSLRNRYNCKPMTRCSLYSETVSPAKLVSFRGSLLAQIKASL